MDWVRWLCYLDSKRDNTIRNFNIFIYGNSLCILGDEMISVEEESGAFHTPFRLSSYRVLLM